MKPVSRATGRTAVAAAAYRAACTLVDHASGQEHDYTRKDGVVHSEIVLPEGVDSDWARDRESLWNAADAAETRKDARVAREFEVALPADLSETEREDLVRSFAQGLANRYGAGVDFAIHAPSRRGDVRNYHAHVLMTVRAVTPEGLGEKTEIEKSNTWLKEEGLRSTHDQLRLIRKGWERLSNEALARAGLDIRVDCRSHEDRGLNMEPSQHVGVQATRLDRDGMPVTRQRLDDGAKQINADVVRERPEDLLALLAAEKSVFTAVDVQRALWRCKASPEEVPELVDLVLDSPTVVQLQGPPSDMAPDAPGAQPARYSTQEMIDIETGMADGVLRMKERKKHGVSQGTIERSFERQVRVLGGEGLSADQKDAVRHVTGAEQVSVVVGHAGTGKSTMLSAAREAWEAGGYRVLGGTLAGKAAEGLEESSGIASRTLASWERSWALGKEGLGRRDVLVIDEAGMLGSRQMAGFVSAVEKAGAKLVLVGDAEQLQAIGPGGAFRAITERVGASGLDGVRRQREDWQREASVAFATQRTAEALTAYDENGGIAFVEAGTGVEALAKAYVERARRGGKKWQLALAHRRADVRALNEAIRRGLRAWKDIQPEAKELVFETRDGPRAFAIGDRFLFLENNREMGVKNGTAGIVTRVKPDFICVRLDNRKEVEVRVDEYNAFDHGYATTIHKAQGVTVQRAFVLASKTMDRHLAYVSMTRHSDEVTMFADKKAFPDRTSLIRSMSRVGLKDTTLDYLDGYAVKPPAPVDDPLVRTGMDKALINYGRAAGDVLAYRSAGVPVIDARKQALRTASRALNRQEAGLADRLNAILKRDEGLSADLTALTGKDVAKRLKQALADQDALDRDPAFRLEQFVERWVQTMKEQEDLYEKRRINKRQVRRNLKALTDEMARDPIVLGMLKQGVKKLHSGKALEPEIAAGLLEGKLSDRMEQLARHRAISARVNRSKSRSLDSGPDM